MNSQHLNVSNAVALYLEDCLAREQSFRTIEGKSSTLNQFVRYCDSNGISDISLITLSQLEGYRRFLIKQVKPNGEMLDISTRRNKLTHVRVFFRRLYELEYLEKNPADKFLVPKRPRRLPEGILSPEELEAIFQQTEIYGPKGVRDKVVLEMYYASGMRRAELAGLAVFDVDTVKNLVRIRNGKGRKDRIVPIAKRTSEMVTCYLNTIRPKLSSIASGDTLFLNDRSTPFTPQQLSSLVRKYVTYAGVRRKGACNLYRHTAATQMLENGADIRIIQEQLGHADISTTQVYTHVTNKQLVETYQRTHPAALNGK